jgi:N-dimethylarginine dimethylaminohydrolase
MKNIFIITLLFLFSCKSDEFRTKNKRIKLIESTTLDGWGYHIVKVDSSEFLCSRGGVIKL